MQGLLVTCKLAQPFQAGFADLAVLHLAAQSRQVRVAHAPWSNHGMSRCSHCQLLEPAHPAGDGRTFTLVLDLCRHAIVLWVSDESRDELPLNAGSIAALHSRLVAMLERNGLPSTFHSTPSEIDGALPFAEDRAPRAYDRKSANRLRERWRDAAVGRHFRATLSEGSRSFLVGRFDLAVTRFSVRPAPSHPARAGLPTASRAKPIARSYRAASGRRRPPSRRSLRSAYPDRSLSHREHRQRPFEDLCLIHPALCRTTLSIDPPQCDDFLHPTKPPPTLPVGAPLPRPPPRCGLSGRTVREMVWRFSGPPLPPLAGGSKGHCILGRSSGRPTGGRGRLAGRSVDKRSRRVAQVAAGRPPQAVVAKIGAIGRSIAG